MSAFNNITGMTFGRLMVMRRAQTLNRSIRWECLCECGNTSVSRSQNLLSGHTQSCGCIQREKVTTHGHTKNGVSRKMYGAWRGIVARCTKPRDRHWAMYGGRGITVCGQWLKFENFFADMGEPPTAQHSIDRIDNSGNYEPGNCRWATKKEQSRNTRANRIVDVDGQRKTVIEWSEIVGLTHNLILKRLNAGWTPEMATSSPPRPYCRRSSG